MLIERRGIALYQEIEKVLAGAVKWILSIESHVIAAQKSLSRRKSKDHIRSIHQRAPVKGQQQQQYKYAHFP